MVEINFGGKLLMELMREFFLHSTQIFTHNYFPFEIQNPCNQTNTRTKSHVPSNGTLAIWIDNIRIPYLW